MLSYALQRIQMPVLRTHGPAHTPGKVKEVPCFLVQFVSYFLVQITPFKLPQTLRNPPAPCTMQAHVPAGGGGAHTPGGGHLAQLRELGAQAGQAAGQEGVCVCLCVCPCVCVCVCVCACVCMCMCVCAMCVCMCACMYVCAPACVHVCAHPLPPSAWSAQVLDEFRPRYQAARSALRSRKRRADCLSGHALPFPPGTPLSQRLLLQSSWFG